MLSSAQLNMISLHEGTLTYPTLYAMRAARFGVVWTSYWRFE